MQPNLKVMLIGSNGQLGLSLRKVVNEHPELGIELLCYTKEELSITDISALENAFGKNQPDAVINAAAYTAVDKAEVEKEQAFEVNALGAGILAGLCTRHSVTLVHVSTDYVFDGLTGEPYKIDAPVAPLGVYGLSKYHGELVVVEKCPSALIVRTSWVFSEFGNNFLKTMLKLASERDTLSIVKDQLGGPTYAPHLAFFILQLLLLKGRRSGIYHFSGQPYCSWYDFAAVIFKSAFDKKMIGVIPQVIAIPTTSYPTPATRPLFTCLDLSDSKIPGIIFYNNWQEGVMCALDGLKQRHD
ncbi:dTDP-4-dehydrorhamnose reductase [Nitrincola tapanii]|uniref:dTDP-4-dehydrorhamnose reductase n=1 Tax=Nitrincola tapanii TaxID=1708751 RepID=A0A5A9W0Y1_9GAMM|nr:dTDP-4-dehydrorhamnose reductase [Nitrincola tapanii]KAA0874377.1 dTDP-4-dehydrorhamnose reductase [Nitrincola tapanii]